jgi:5-formyltetrahydrofolate cyclo-ligase
MVSNKQGLRKLMLDKLSSQKEEAARKRSLKIKEKLFQLKAFKRAKTVMFYLALKSEVETREMIEGAISLGKRVVIPTCDIKHRKIIPCLVTGLEAKDFKRGSYGIDEPCARKAHWSEKIDLCIVPGLAFDAKGNRLGRGLGYYDRFLSTLSPDTVKIGLAFKFQVLPRLPCILPCDINVDKVLFA